MTSPPSENVVPIGTRGRPGRGSRSATPSSAARLLAGGTRPDKPRVIGVPEPVTEAADEPARKPAKKTTTKKTTTKKTSAKKSSAKTAKKSAAKTAEEAPAERSGAATAPPSAVPESSEPSSSGIPLADWVEALTIGAREVLGDDWQRKGAELLAFVRRRITGAYEVDEFGLDKQIQEVLLAALRPLAQKWFRVEVRGVENIPAEGGALVVCNHSGTIPIDAAVTGLVVHDHAQRNLRMLGADLVFTLPFVGELARKTGATLACTEDAERLLRSGHIAGVWPEGFKGIGKPYSERYKLQRFGRGGFVSSAMRAGAPIVPTSIVGAEEIYPLVGNVPSLARLLGLPYLPITPFFPWLGPLGLVPLPSKWIIEFGEPIRTDAYDVDAADDPMLVFNVTDQVRETIQQTLYGLLVDRGHPFR